MNLETCVASHDNHGDSESCCPQSRYDRALMFLKVIAFTLDFLLLINTLLADEQNDLQHSFQQEIPFNTFTNKHQQDWSC